MSLPGTVPLVVDRDTPTASYSPVASESAELSVGTITVSPRAIEILVKALTRGTPYDRLQTGLREALQNAIDASLKRRALEGHRAPGQIALRIEGTDLVLRDDGIGMEPHQINSLILRLFASGKDNGLGGFGAGAFSVLYAAPEVIIRTRPANGPGAEFRQSWLNQRAPALMTPAEAATFGVGTEVRFANLIGPHPDGGYLAESAVRRAISECIQTSAFPRDLTVTLDDAPIPPAFVTTSETRRSEPDMPDVFPGALLAYHVIVLPADEADRRAPLEQPRLYVRLEDPNGTGTALTQWSEYLDSSVNFSLVVDVRPTVPPGHADYPFNPERSDIAVRQVREAISRARQRFVTDRLTAIKQQTWHTRYYIGASDEGSTTAADAALARAVQTPESLARIEIMVSAVRTLGFEQWERFQAQQAALVTRVRGSVETVAQAIAGQPSMTMVHARWERPVWAPRRFNPNRPACIERLAPLLVAMRLLGGIIRAEAAQLVDHAWAYEQPGPYYGFVFSPTENAMLHTDDTPLGPTTRFVLLNPLTDALRAARTSEAMCDMVVGRLVHEHAHEATSWHDEAFATLVDTLRDRLANLRPALLAAWKASRAWQAMRRLQGLPLRATPAERC